MQVPESIADRFPVVSVLEDDWEPVPRIASIAWLAFYAILLISAASGTTWNEGLLQWFDLVFIPIHEGGHLLFGWFGSHWLMVAGGTLMQLLVPFALAAYFVFRREVPGTAFCLFFLFEQLLPIATYMADARAQELPLLTVGDPEFVEHDWFYLFSHAGVLQRDTQIAGFVRTAGWIGMLIVVAWLAWRARPGTTGRKG